jgi:integrase
VRRSAALLKPLEDWTGIYRHGAGYRAIVSRGRGVSPAMKHFPAGTALEEMQAWREDERARLRLKRKQRASRGTFEGDARAYLRAVASLTTITDRRRQIELWIKEFGTRQRESISSVDIRAVLNRWLTEPRSKGLPPVSAATVNLRKRALQNLYTVLDADADPPMKNPVRAIDDFDEAPPRPRDLPYDVIARILARMPDRGRMAKGETRKGKGADDFSISKIIATILAYTGLEFVQLERLRRPDVDLEAGFVVLESRKKGKRRKTSIEVLPLVPPAIEAFKMFDTRGLWKRPITRSGVRKAFKAAAKHEGVDVVRIKDLRHSYATIALETTEDLQAVRDLLMQRTSMMTKRYAARALAKRLQAKLAPLVRHFGMTSVKEVEET